MHRMTAPKGWRSLVLAAGLGLGLLSAGQASAAGEAIALPDKSWGFEGIFGSFDRAAAQRGFQVYSEVCASCHGLKYIAFRNLADLGYTEDEITAFAAERFVMDGPDEEGEMFERNAIASDYFPDPYTNVQQAAAFNNGAIPPDLSLMAKARANGADYLHALMVGYVEPPADFELMEGLNYNAYFPGHQIAMAQPLYEDSVTYADGTPATIDQMATDLVYFLMWTAEPTLEDRKQTGIKVMLFLLVFTGVMYAIKRKVWSELH